MEPNLPTPGILIHPELAAAGCQGGQSLMEQPNKLKGSQPKLLHNNGGHKAPTNFLKRHWTLLYNTGMLQMETSRHFPHSGFNSQSKRHAPTGKHVATSTPAVRGRGTYNQPHLTQSWISIISLAQLQGFVQRWAPSTHQWAVSETEEVNSVGKLAVAVLTLLLPAASSSEIDQVFLAQS